MCKLCDDGGEHGHEPAESQSALTDVLADPFQAVLDTIDDIKSGPWESSLTPIGFVDINGDKAQVQIRVTKDPYDWVEATNGQIKAGGALPDQET